MNIISVQCLCMYMCIYIYIYIYFYARLTQRVYSVWQVARPVVGEMELHSVTNLATFQTLSATFFPSKSAQTLFRFWESPVLPLSLSLSLCICSCSVSVQEAERSSALIQLNTDIMLFFKFYMQVYLKSQHSYCLYLVCIWFNQTTTRLSGFLCRLTSWKGELVM